MPYVICDSTCFFLDWLTLVSFNPSRFFPLPLSLSPVFSYKKSTHENVSNPNNYSMPLEFGLRLFFRFNFADFHFLNYTCTGVWCTELIAGIEAVKKLLVALSRWIRIALAPAAPRYGTSNGSKVCGNGLFMFAQ